jgi:hypothetical protein
MNPARRLHNTLIDWQSQHTNGAQSVGSTRLLNTDEGMQRQIDALDDLREIEAKLDVLEAEGVRVVVSRRYVPVWRRMTLGYPNGWSSQADPADVYNESAIDQLETLADRLDERLPDLTDVEKTKLQGIVGDALELLHADETLSKPLKLYLGRLIGEIQNAMLDEKYGERFDYPAAARRLWVTLMAAAQDSTDEKQKPKWRDTTKRFMWDASVSAIGNAPGLLLALPGLS